MKIFKKTAIFGIAAVLACGACALAACGKEGGQDGFTGEVSDSEWQTYLDINAETCDNLTFTTKNYNTYSKTEAATYGEWENSTSTYEIDQKNEIVHVTRAEEQYEPGTQTFTTRNTDAYYFAYRGAYYHWEKSETEPNHIWPITKTQFIEQAEEMSNIGMQQMAAYKTYKNLFKYNKETNAYDLMQAGSMSLSLQFLEGGGVRTILKQNSVTTVENIVTAVDKTEVSVPASVKADVDAFIAENA